MSVGHYEDRTVEVAIVKGIRRKATEWVPVSPATGRSGERACSDCGAELQSVTHRGKTVLRCPWARGSKPAGAIWGCGKPYSRSGRG